MAGFEPSCWCSELNIGPLEEKTKGAPDFCATSPALPR